MSIQLTDVKIPALFQIPGFFVNSAEKILIQGPSGKGKTSLLHLIGGILRPEAGQVKINGQDLYLLSDSELSLFRRQKIGLIYQKLNLIEHLTGLENIQLVAKEKNPEKALALLKKLDLEKQAPRWATYLSLGEQQRIAIGRVLLQEPEIILADEPTSSLDRINTEKVMALLLEAAAGKTLIVVSHDDRIEKYFDRVVQLEELLA